MNLKIREMKITIENYINGVDLPPEVKRMVLKEIYDEISTESNKAITAELAEREAQKGEEKQDEQVI